MGFSIQRHMPSHRSPRLKIAPFPVSQFILMLAFYCSAISLTSVLDPNPLPGTQAKSLYKAYGYNFLFT